MSGRAVAKFYWQLQTRQTKQLKIVKGLESIFYRLASPTLPLAYNHVGFRSDLSRALWPFTVSRLH